MRLRATRTSATGCNARKRALTIGQLLPSGLGRVAAIYTDPERPSYDEVFAQNRKALGPELVTVGLSAWTSVGTVPANTVMNGAVAEVSGTGGGYQGLRLNIPSIVPGKTYLLAITADKGTANTSLVVAGPTNPSGYFTGGKQLLIIPVIAAAQKIEILINSANCTGTFSVYSVSLCEVDLSRCVLFDDPTGTVPVFSVFQSSRGRGLLLDRSQGLARGVPLVASSVALTGAVDNGGGSYTLTAPGAFPRFSYPLASLEQGATYEISFRVTAVVGAASVSTDWCDANPLSVVPVVGGTYRFLGRRDTYDATYRFLDIGLTSAAGTSITVDQITVAKLAGNHMVQPTAAARGEFWARYNELNNSVFAGGGTTPTGWTRPVGTGTSVPGAPLADGSVPYTQTGFIGERPFFEQSFSEVLPVGYVKRHRISIIGPTVGTVQVQHLLQRSGTAVTSAQYFLDGVACPVTQPVTGTSVIEVAWTVTTAGTCFFRCGPGGSGPMPDAFSVTFARPDMRPNADAITSIPAYQAVRSPTDYETVGFPVKHRSVTDDSAKARVNPIGASKLLVLTAIQKMSETASGILVESSPNSDTNNGAFRLVAPASSGANPASFVSRGAGAAIAQAAVAPAAAYSSPARLVLQGYGSIAEQICRTTINGVLASSSTASQGTGAYTEQDVYFGSRGGTSLFANTNEFAPPLILFMQPDDTLSASHLARLQAGYAKAAGVTL